MCLKLYHSYTFSNKEAFIRFLGRLRSSEYCAKSPPSGTIYVAYGIRPNHIKKDWNKFTFEELLAMEQIHFFKCKYFGLWWTWKRFFEDMDEIEKAEFVFGKVEIEMF